MEQNKQMLPPDFIETNLQLTKKRFRIPTNSNKEVRGKRRDIIREAYKLLLSRLGSNNFIKNDFLNQNIHIIWKESFQKASNNATRNWQTTYAVLKRLTCKSLCLGVDFLKPEEKEPYVGYAS